MELLACNVEVAFEVESIIPVVSSTSHVDDEPEEVDDDDDIYEFY